MTDRAAVVARAIRQMICDGATDANVAAYLREEFADERRQVAGERELPDD
jgi:hypothetical protein